MALSAEQALTCKQNHVQHLAYCCSNSMRQIVCNTLRRAMRSTFLHFTFLHFTFLISHFSFLICTAQTITTRSDMVGYGSTRVLDTYLSQEHFKGWGVSFLSTKEQQHPDSRWSTLMEHEANFASVDDRASSKSEIEAAYNLYWGRLYRWQLMDKRLTLQGGAMGNLTLGAIYSNNPAQARLHLNVMPTGVATYRSQLFRHPFTVRYELNLPLLGVMFSPNYGQSYYEIFSLGHYDRNVVPTTPLSAPEWRQMLTVDTPVSRRLTLRFGYLGNMQQSDVNNIKQHVYTHRFMIGLTRRFSIQMKRNERNEEK